MRTTIINIVGLGLTVFQTTLLKSWHAQSEVASKAKNIACRFDDSKAQQYLEEPLASKHHTVRKQAHHLMVIGSLNHAAFLVTCSVVLRGVAGQAPSSSSCDTNGPRIACGEKHLLRASKVSHFHACSTLLITRPALRVAEGTWSDRCLLVLL